LLEVFPKYRRSGYGAILQSYMVNKIIEKGLVPFCQIEIKNEKHTLSISAVHLLHFGSN